MSAGKVARLLAAVALAASLAACGSDSRDGAQAGIAVGWDQTPVDAQVQVCDAWANNPKIVVTEFAREISGKGYTPADVNKFLAGHCG